MTLALRLIIGLALAGGVPAAAAAQTPAPAPAPAPAAPAPDMAAFVERHSRPLALEGERISGPGADFLLAQSSNAQFILLAEYVSHIDHATPLFMGALFSALHDRHGFNYVGVEQDPFGMELVSTDPVRGNLQRIADAVRRWPYAFTFQTDEEMRMFAQVGRTSTGGWRPLWGVDQAFGAAMPLEELLGLAPSPEAAAAVEEMLAEARRREVLVPDFGDWRGTRDFKTGHFVGGQTAGNLPRLERIRALYRPIRGSRADELLRGLESSSLIYSYNYRHRELSPEGEPYGYYSNAIREQWMKDRFLDNYRHALAADGGLPRVLVKAGTVHLTRGRSLTNIFSLGNMLHEFAITNRMHAWNIVMLPIRKEDWPSFDKVPPELKPLLPSRDLTSGRLVDLRPLRAHLHRGQAFGLEGDALRDFRNLVYGTDFALFLPSGQGTYTLTAPRPASPWKRPKRAR